MGSFSKGEIVLFPFPFTNLKERKLRPCLIVSEEMAEDLILCQITSKATSGDKYSLELKEVDCLNGTLMVDSYVRCNMLFTASKYQITRKVCKVTSKKYNQIIQKILSIIS